MTMMRGKTAGKGIGGAQAARRSRLWDGLIETQRTPSDCFSIPSSGARIGWNAWRDSCRRGRPIRLFLIGWEL